jgi:ABC-2 type transport system permease protein
VNPIHAPTDSDLAHALDSSDGDSPTEATAASRTGASGGADADRAERLQPTTFDAVAALVSRDLRLFVRSRSQLTSSVIFPLLLLAIIGAGVTDGLDPRNIEDYVTFMVPGVIVLTALFSATFTTASIYQDRDTGMLGVFLSTPHPSHAIVAGKIVASVTIGVGQALFVLAAAATIPEIDFDLAHGTAVGLAIAIGGIVLLNLFLSGIAQWIASHIASNTGFHLVMNLVLFPCLFFSGAFFPLDDLPVWLKALGTVNPLSYAVDLLQVALYGRGIDGYFGLVADFAVTGALAAGALFLGSTRRLAPEG